MINNIGDFILKYRSQINSKKELENNILNILNKDLNINLNKNNIKIDFKNKVVNIKNINSSVRFYLKNKININLIEKIKKETEFNLIF